MKWELIDSAEEVIEKEIRECEQAMNQYLTLMAQDLLGGDKARDWLCDTIQDIYTDRLVKVRIEETGDKSIRMSLFGKRGND